MSEAQQGEQFFDGGWAWMCHPSRNDGNPIPVKMELVDGTRFYKPLDPSTATEFEWDRRDDEWQMIVPDASAEQASHNEKRLESLSREAHSWWTAAAATAKERDALLKALSDLLAETTTPDEIWEDGTAVTRARAVIARTGTNATGEVAQSGSAASTAGSLVQIQPSPTV